MLLGTEIVVWYMGSTGPKFGGTVLKRWIVQYGNVQGLKLDECWYLMGVDGSGLPCIVSKLEL